MDHFIEKADTTYLFLDGAFHSVFCLLEPVMLAGWGLLLWVLTSLLRGGKEDLCLWWGILSARLLTVSLGFIVFNRSCHAPPNARGTVRSAEYGVLRVPFLRVC